jgi:hypothetical protein
MEISSVYKTKILLASLLTAIKPALCRAVPAMALVCLLSWCCITFRSGFDCDDANPEILNMSWQLANGEDIYRDIHVPPYAFAAYSPLYYAIVALPLKLTGLSYLPARGITLVALFFIGWAFAQLSGIWNKKPGYGIWAVLLGVTVPAVLYNSIRCHPQMMAVALSLWSLVFFLRNRWFPTLVISPILAVLAFYTKQSQIALPIALALYLAWNRRQWLIPYVLVGLATGLAPFLWLQKITSGRFFLDAFRLAELAFDFGKIPITLLHWAGPIFLFIAVALVVLWRRFRTERWTPLDWYLACLFPITVISLGRAGSHSQYVVELIFGVLLYLLHTTGLPEIKGRDVLVAVQILCLFGYGLAFIFIEEGPWDYAALRSADKVFSLVAKDHAPILSQQGSFPLFSRGRIYIQLFHFIGMWHVGLWDQELLLKEIRAHHYSWVILQRRLDDPNPVDSHDDKYTPEMVAMLRRNYELHSIFYPYYVYIPRCHPEIAAGRAGP